MKVLVYVSLSLFFGISGFCQAPEFFKYQSIARTISGDVLANAALGIRISIHTNLPTGSVIFQETHTVVTNQFGLFSLSIGGGVAVSGSIQAIDWGNGAKYIEVEGDFSGGTNYETFGNTQLVSVPYALYAATSGNSFLPNGTANGNTPFWNGLEWLVNSASLFNDGQSVGIGTVTPLQKLQVEGNMNISLDSSYMINNRKILWEKGTANIFVGKNAGNSNSIGFSNAFLGYNSGAFNSVGSQNTFLGAESGTTNIDGMMNSFVGRRAGFLNTNGSENTFIGAFSGQSNTEGQHNSFIGVTTGNSNTLGQENTFIGAHAGYFNILGSYNSFIGNFAAIGNVSGNYNTIIGFEANVASGNLSNAAALGSGAIVNASNSVIIGNSAVTSIGGQVGWGTFSDRRLKTGVKNNTLGLEFIQKLQPVDYSYTTKGQENLIYSGLIAQDVEEILETLNCEFSGLVKPQNNNDFYSIRYAEFVIPLINAVKEQQQQMDKLKEKNDMLELKMKDLEEKMNMLLEKSH